MTVPLDKRFTATHAWVQPQDDGETIRVGVTDYLQEHLSDVIAVDLPEPDDHHYEADEDICCIEAINTTTDLHAPAAGVILAINTDLHGSPELINSDPYGDGWIVLMRPDNMADIDELIDVDEYEMSLPEEDDEEE